MPKIPEQELSNWIEGRRDAAIAHIRIKGGMRWGFSVERFAVAMGMAPPRKNGREEWSYALNQFLQYLEDEELVEVCQPYLHARDFRYYVFIKGFAPQPRVRPTPEKGIQGGQGYWKAVGEKADQAIALLQQHQSLTAHELATSIGFTLTSYNPRQWPPIFKRSLDELKRRGSIVMQKQANGSWLISSKNDRRASA